MYRGHGPGAPVKPNFTKTRKWSCIGATMMPLKHPGVNSDLGSMAYYFDLETFIRTFLCETRAANPDTFLVGSPVTILPRAGRWRCNLAEMQDC